MDPKKLSWMRSLRWLLHGKLYILFHDMPKFALGPPPRSRLDANFGRPCQWYNLYTRANDPHNHTVTTFGSCVKWPSVQCKSIHAINHIPPKTHFYWLYITWAMISTLYLPLQVNPKCEIESMAGKPVHVAKGPSFFLFSFLYIYIYQN